MSELTNRVLVSDILQPKHKPRAITNFWQFISTVREKFLLVHPKGYSFIHEDPVGGKEDLDNLDVPIITYRMASRTKAKMGSVMEQKPRIRTVVVDPNNPQQQTTYYGHRFLNLVEFGIWDTSWEKLEQTVEMFEDFMTTWTGIFMELGVSQIIFVEGAEDIPKPQVDRIDLVSYHVIYEVYIEKNIDVMNQVIEKIDINTNNFYEEE